MIKINISEEQKEKIEKIIWNDAITASTGILKELNKNRSAQFWNDSDKFHKLYNLLYDDNGTLRYFYKNYKNYYYHQKEK